MFYKKKNFIKKKSNIKICYKLNKEFSTDGVTLSVKARPKLFFKNILTYF